MLDVSQNLLDKFHRFRCGHPPINAHHYGWPIVDLARGDVPAFHVRTENPKYARIRTLQDAEVFLETERRDYRMFGPEERRRGGVLRTHEDGVRPSRALGGTYPRRGARPGRRLHPLVRPRAHQTVARLDESGTIPSEPGNGCVIISKKTSAAPLPFAISHGTLIPMGFSSTLDDALSQSVEHAINMIAAMFEMPRQQVYLLLSAAIDFNVTQVVDITPKAFTV